MKNNLFKHFLILVAVAGGANYAYLNKEQIAEVCFGNKDLPELSNAKILLWSDPKTWGGGMPEENTVIVIPPGKTILLDISPPKLKSLEVVGTLIFADKDIKLSMKSLLLTGVIQIGSPNKAFVHNAEINLIGDDSKFLLQGGRLALFGIKDAARSPSSSNSNWGFANFDNIILQRKNEP